MKLLTKEEIGKYFYNKRVVLIGSAPSCLRNKGSNINEYDIVVRVNNYKIKGFEDKVGNRTDVFYSFFGSSIRNTKEELQRDGVKIMMCKCANSYCHESADKKRNLGGDFRWIYKNRADWWFTPVYIPTTDQYMKWFNLLDGHVPTTGFSAILELSELYLKELYITGYDFFRSKLHNVDAPWRLKNPDDPVGHRPEKELERLGMICRLNKFIKLDDTLKGII